MTPQRLERAWTWQLPGAAMLTVDRFAAAVGIAAQRRAVPETGGERAADETGGPGVLVEGVRRRSAEVRRWLGETREALVAGDRVAAARAVVEARALGDALVDPIVDAWTDMFASMIAVADGAAELAAGLSLRAERAALRAQDAPSFLAVWWTRAVRALRRGHAADGVAIAGWMRPWLDEVAPALGGWLRCFEAAHHLDDGKHHLAIATCAPVLARARETPAGWAAGRLVTRGFLLIGRPDDAARIAVATLDHAASAPDAVRAQCYAGAADAFEATDLADAAARCATIAGGLDPRVTADPTRAEIAGAGIELVLL